MTTPTTPTAPGTPDVTSAGVVPGAMGMVSGTGTGDAGASRVVTRLAAGIVGILAAMVTGVCGLVAGVLVRTAGGGQARVSEAFGGRR
ncbi:hypothetical protein OG394_39590 [Kribbella sp. NBC_01245]|uniref:hypothetical protein n=1 Tax=Kribbella sp. NBC_01245 TaxID=2903578 RepID=UPI002E2911E2|nr:hypothetical protein [Kribbella sp. NBC_01245]